MAKEQVKLTAAQKNLVEKLGVFYEQSGISPVAARILALLIVADEHDLTFDQLQTTLAISKSATSTSLSLLINTGKIEQVTRLGERKRFFRNKLVHWKEDMAKKTDQMGLVADLFRQILKQRPGDTTEFNKSLKDLIDFMEFLRVELPALYKKWESKRK